ncbi:PREDICTED: leucine-rich repeat-containing protein 15-like [Branchiostoma belcheri]|uniref:Leucine-rich repeat-containing protein 15-like n=1 Tax=Branchiostoma belcheri TaxID=7741 RepID=A0A6P5A2U0_BRABE|nr:PREDICTED: leucine-rich repeat-containing protein 15-like [Branchiostoma belcheri]
MFRLAAILAVCTSLVGLTAALQACGSSRGPRTPRWTGGDCSCSGGIVNCEDKNLAAVPDNIPAYTTSLSLQHNKIVELEDGKFQHLESLTSLLLSNNQITAIRSRAFAGLKNLDILFLQNNNIRVVEPGSFQGLQELTCLRLQYNKLTTLHGDTFSTLYKLRELLLHHNQLKTLPHDIFDSLGQQPPSTPSIQLHDNPWSCDCSLEPARSSFWSNQIVCQSPPALRNIPLSSLATHQLSCPSTTSKTSTSNTTPASTRPWPMSTSTVNTVSSTTASSPTGGTEEGTGNSPGTVHVPTLISVAIGCGVFALNLCAIVGIVCYVRGKRNGSRENPSSQPEDSGPDAGEDGSEYEDVLVPEGRRGGRVQYAVIATENQGSASSSEWSTHAYETIRSDDLEEDSSGYLAMR